MVINIIFILLNGWQMISIRKLFWAGWFSCHERRAFSFDNMFYLLVMDIRVEHHEVILLCLVYEGVFYDQARGCKSRNVGKY